MVSRYGNAGNDDPPFFEGDDRPFPLHFLPPPYTGALPPPATSPGRMPLRDVPDGTLLVMDVLEPADPLPELERWIEQVVARGPAAALILRVPERTPAGLVVETARRSGLFQVDAVVEEGRWRIDDLRNTLTTPDRLITRLVRWMELRRGEEFPADVRVPLSGWLAPARRSRAKEEERTPLSVVSQALRARLVEEALPTPRRIIQLGETLPTVLRIQGEPETSIERIALASGLAASYSLLRRSRTLFGLPPSAFRGTLGWQWVVERWIERFCGGGGP